MEAFWAWCYTKPMFIENLESIIDRRVSSQDTNSYVSTLTQSGIDRILKKIGEESGEVIIAAKNNDRTELIYESADLIFHLIVLLRAQGISIHDIDAELARRHPQ